MNARLQLHSVSFHSSNVPSLSYVRPSQVLLLLQPNSDYSSFLELTSTCPVPTEIQLPPGSPPWNPGVGVLPRVCSHSIVHPLHFTWLEWPASCLLSLDSELLSAGIWSFCYCGTPSGTKSRTSTNNWLANSKMSRGMTGDENTSVRVIDRELLISVRHREEL